MGPNESTHLSCPTPPTTACCCYPPLNAYGLFLPRLFVYIIAMAKAATPKAMARIMGAAMTAALSSPGSSKVGCFSQAASLVRPATTMRSAKKGRSLEKTSM
mmetsp:Transcript_4780/g.10163  ORF Transcript_4780/g.10163 Transcript_4780/m.10163 type:complete len:102 (-) Transcript_4780:585-890(-)